MTPKFSHRFSGVSVWVEPDPHHSSQLINEMEYLRTKCGGHEAGLYTFVPHCTLLYNTSLHFDGDEITDGDNCKQTTKKQQGQTLLRQCLKEYRQQTTITSRNNDQQHSDTDHKPLELIPTSQYYFPYPKTADNGKGFGCCISLLILETTPQLKLLYDIVRNIFPPDERHGSDDSGNSDGESNDSNMDEGEVPRFRPHMALVYAPEGQENVINGWLEKYTLQNEEEKRYEQWVPAKKNDLKSDDNDNYGDKEECSDEKSWSGKYLSLWSTEGTLDEWYPICKLDLEAEII